MCLSRGAGVPAPAHDEEKIAMEKSLVSLAALAAAGVASGQTSLTLFGVVDANVTYLRTTSSFVGIPGAPVINFVGTGDLHQSQWSVNSSGYNASRLGFRGTEDLGGGLAVAFWLEAAMTNDDGRAYFLSVVRP
jgi:predicted porin